MRRNYGDLTLRGAERMRLCYIGNYANIHTRRWTGFFAQQGHEVHVISTTPVREDEVSSVKIHSLATYRTGNYLLDLLLGLLSMFRRVADLKRLIHEIAPDVVHVHYITDAALFALLTGYRPIVLTAWGSDILVSPEQSWIRKQVVKYIVSKADLITCDADHMKRRIVDLGAAPDSVEIIFFGTDIERFQPKRRDNRLRLKVAPAGGPVIISIRNLEPVYDIESMVRAVPFVCERFPTATFLIGGSGSLRGSLQDLTKELGIEQNVLFLGSLSQEELPSYLASSDVYISTALSDGGISASTAEAMASGVPVVITDVGDNSQWVQDGMNGFLVPPKDPSSVAKRTIQLLEAADIRLRMGKRGRQEIMERNNLYTEMKKMEGLYHVWAEKAPSRSPAGK
ncbi:glycosyltransferase family 4 protein [Nitrospiraceae bacterium HYJII51-Mn-bac16s-1-B09]|uniref:Glycosyltransferase family 4 protein n=2 Tax=Candidatus Manganitrophus noduliformans TaxID=2606439 RepID=A0A7X6ICT2_9BACT|nr:glycosyltransferase family 4 protein [Candidatus Manganitrophus noduliformans]